jgi:hypothetical protein
VRRLHARIYDIANVGLGLDVVVELGEEGGSVGVVADLEELDAELEGRQAGVV